MPFNLSVDPKNVFYRCVEDSNEAIMISDRQGKLVYVNPAWCAIYGFTREEAIGATPKLLHSGHHSAEFYREMWGAIQDPTIGHWRGEIINRAKNGRLVPVLLTITPFKGEEGRLDGYMGIALDMTHRKELEAKVAQQDRLASVGLLASGLAHEIGTPLGVIRGRAEFLQMQVQDPNASKYLEVIVGQIDRISTLIRSLLRISRSTSDFRMEPVKVSEVVTEVLTLVGQNVRAGHGKIENQVDPELRVMGDFNRLEQVYLNLVMNAIHAMKKAGEEGRTEPGTLSLLSERRGQKVALLVQDNGCGISPENMKKLFKPFFTTKAVGEGTGLGLAIVSQLVSEMGGEISAESELGRGTTFTLILDPAV